jgi:PKD repeat protein
LDFGSETILIKIQLETVAVSSWEIESSDSWLIARPDSGNTNREVWVNVERSSLLPGIYEGSLEIGATSGTIAGIRVPVGMQVNEGWNGDIEGYVYDEDTGNGIGEVHVRLHNPNTSIDFETSTDLTGYYEFNLIAQGNTYSLSASKEGYGLNSESVEPIGGTVVQQDLYLKAFDTNGLSVSIEAAPTEGFAPVAVQFSAVVTEGNPPYSYFWDFGDGLSSILQNPIHVFGTPGEFLVNLMVTDAQGDEATDLVTIEVLDSQSGTTASSTTTTTDDLPSSTTTSSGSSTTTTAIIDISIRRLH